MGRSGQGRAVVKTGMGKVGSGGHGQGSDRGKPYPTVVPTDGCFVLVVARRSVVWAGMDKDEPLSLRMGVSSWLWRGGVLYGWERTRTGRFLCWYFLEFD